jgi:hypothetical protein
MGLVETITEQGAIHSNTKSAGQNSGRCVWANAFPGDNMVAPLQKARFV